jgi:hypothetical protein
MTTKETSYTFNEKELLEFIETIEEGTIEKIVKSDATDIELMSFASWFYKDELDTFIKQLQIAHERNERAYEEAKRGISISNLF